MSRLLFPRLGDAVATGVWDACSSLSVSELSSRADRYHEFAVYAQTGGHRISPAELSKIRDGIVEIAANLGFPESVTRERRAQFDAEAAVWLLENGNISIGEAMHREVWTFFALVLLPDVCRWRFPEAGRERFFGGVRNVLQRLWMRAFLFGGSVEDESRWALLPQLTEDAFVAVVERPGLSSNPEIARCIGNVWVETASEIGRNKMESVHREAMKRIREISPVICLDMLAEHELKELIIEAFRKAVNSSHSEQCEACEGTGLINQKVCRVCGGSGTISGVANKGGSMQCANCSGTGLSHGKTCEICGGYGIIEN